MSLLLQQACCSSLPAALPSARLSCMQPLGLPAPGAACRPVPLPGTLLLQEEWQALVARRMQYLGHVQSDYIVNAAEAEVAQWGEVSFRLAAAGWLAGPAVTLWTAQDCLGERYCGLPLQWHLLLSHSPDLLLPSCLCVQDGPLGSPWDHSGSLPGSGLFGGGGAPHAAHATPLGALDDIDYDPDADEAAVAAEAAAAAARRAAVVAAASAPPSRAASRQPSPRAPMLGAAAGALPPVPPLPATLLPGLGGSGVPLPPAAATAAAPPLLPAQPGSPLGPQASVVMEDVENDVEFQSMFESKYETGAGPGAPRRSPSIPNGSSISGGPSGASLMAATHTSAVTARAIATTTWVDIIPNQSTNRGVKKADNAVPTMPIPNTPVAKPRREASYQLFANGIPTAKTVPAMPRKKPKTSSST